MEQLIVGHKTKADSTLITLLLITVVSMSMLYNFIEKKYHKYSLPRACLLMHATILEITLGVTQDCIYSH